MYIFSDCVLPSLVRPSQSLSASDILTRILLAGPPLNMNRPDFSAGGSTSPSSRRELQLQGPRPPPLKVSKESHKIKKPPLPPHAAHHPAPSEPSEQRQPVIIYSVSPKVIHVPVSDFMNVVQQLTGLSSGDISPAARLASIEKTSPSEKERVHSVDDEMFMLEGVEVGQFPGILSPTPSTLQPISSDFFSPAMDPQALSFFHELSPFWSTNNFIASPSGLLSASVVSPLSSPDLFNLFD